MLAASLYLIVIAVLFSAGFLAGAFWAGRSPDEQWERSPLSDEQWARDVDARGAL